MAALISLTCQWALANDACLLTPAELQAATGRAFIAGQAGVTAGGGAPLCHYAEMDQPQRKLTVGLSTENAQRQFESNMRLLKMGAASIELKGVGDAAYFNGTSAGVLSGNTFIHLSNLRRGGSPKIAPERVIELLQAALKRARP
jgi:hypothetical protein